MKVPLQITEEYLYPPTLAVKTTDGVGGEFEIVGDYADVFFFLRIVEHYPTGVERSALESDDLIADYARGLAFGHGQCFQNIVSSVLFEPRHEKAAGRVPPLI